MITATGISKSYGTKPVLDSIDFHVAAGESAVIVGRNGTGKSTLLCILSGYLRPDAGAVTTAGNGSVAFCPQHDNLFEELTVRDNLRFWARARGGPLRQNAPDFTKLLGVEEYAHKRIHQLSGGMKKSVAILCALTGNAPVLILDEPFSGLDIFYKNHLLSALDNLKHMGKCIIYTSHSLDEITGLDSAIYSLANGKLTHVGTRETFTIERIGL